MAIQHAVKQEDCDNDTLPGDDVNYARLHISDIRLQAFHDARCSQEKGHGVQSKRFTTT